jgi:hypothetical protein
MRIIFISIFLSCFLNEALAYNEKQERLLTIAYYEGTKIGFPETIQSILLQETIAGKLGPVGDSNLPFGKKSYCPMQIKLGTAKDVLKTYNMKAPKTDEELLVKLLTDDIYCIKLGALYFKMLHNKLKNWEKAVLSYNQGIGGMKAKRDPNNYVRKVRKLLIEDVRKFNK